MLDANTLYNLAKKANPEITPETATPPQKPLRRAVDVAKTVATPVVGGAVAAVNAIRGFDKPATLNKLP